MKTKTLSDYPGLIGRMLRRRKVREWRRFNRRWTLEIVTLFAAALAGFGTIYSLAWFVKFLIRL